MAKRLHIRTIRGWQFFDQDAEEFCQRFPVGSIQEIDIKVSVNAAFRAKYQVFYSKLFDNQDKYKTIASLKSDSRIELGLYEVTPNGNRVPISPTFDKVDDATLDKDYYQPLIQWAIDLVGEEATELIDQRVNEILSFA